MHLGVDGLPAHKTALVRDYVASTNGLLTLHFLLGYAPEPKPPLATRPSFARRSLRLASPDELVWSHMKRAGPARVPLRKGERPSAKIEVQLATIKRMPQLVRVFFQAPSLAYITDAEQALSW